MFFNNSYRSRRYDGSSILDPEIDVYHLPQKLAYFYYYHTHRKIIEVLDVVFGGYVVGEYFFIPPDDILVDKYAALYSVFFELDRRPDIDELPVTLVRDFKSLHDNFVYCIKMWAKFRDEHFDDSKMLFKIAPQQYYLAPDIKVLFHEIDILLAEHKIKKGRELKKIGDITYSWEQLVLNKSKATLAYKNNQSINISLNKQDIKLLEMLLKNGDRITEYIHVAKELQLNSFDKEYSNKDVARNVQFVKKELHATLGKTGMTKEEVKNMILTITNTGYKLR